MSEDQLRLGRLSRDHEPIPLSPEEEQAVNDAVARAKNALSYWPNWETWHLYMLFTSDYLLKKAATYIANETRKIMQQFSLTDLVDMITPNTITRFVRDIATDLQATGESRLLQNPVASLVIEGLRRTDLARVDFEYLSKKLLVEQGQWVLNNLELRGADK